ncbi:MAG TPA: hypothetical protein VFO85_15760, partial [Vicinamibacteria bacterium]|nr:hypothetical protein [Vicinamibacteria bacterium]
LIHHLTGGWWGLVIRRLLEAGARTLPLCALLFVPLAFGLPRLFEWADAARVQADPVLQHKALYLNVPFFLARAVFYFAVWTFLALAVDRSSVELDAIAGDERRYLRVSRRLRAVSGGGLLLMGLTITFSSIDWAMSLDPHWFSTVYGVLFMVGQAVAAMALMIVLVAALGRQDPLGRVVEPSHVHDLGKLLLAFVMLWAYIHVSQWIIIWSANLPEETPWYIRRLHGGWQWMALFIVVFHFFLPFLMLLSRDLKRDARRLALVAAAVLATRAIDLYWLVAPDAPIGHQGHGGLHLHWMDLTALLGVGGIWLWAFAWALLRRPLLTVGEPDVRARLLEGRA